MDKLDVVLHAGVLVGVGLGIFMGLGAVSNLETSLETFWLAPHTVHKVSKQKTTMAFFVACRIDEC